MTTDQKSKLKTLIERYSLGPAAIGFACAFALLLVFQAGVMVGVKKASFAHKSGDSFMRAFGGPTSSPQFFADRLPGGHGAAGRVVSVSLPSFIVEERNNLEKIVETDPDTSVKVGRDAASPSDIMVGDFVVVLGEPGEDGQVKAKLVRVMEAPPEPRP